MPQSKDKASTERNALPEGGQNAKLESSMAAVDLGSNSFHMVVARARGGGDLEVIDRLKEPVRLAEGLFQKGSISPQARDRALKCLRRFGERLRGIPPNQVKAIGTNALRKAERPLRFLEDASSALGHRIDVISGREEARLIYLGASRALGKPNEKRLIFDVGGGSTELMFGMGDSPLFLESANIGCVGFTEKFFSKSILDKRAFEKARMRSLLDLRPLVPVFAANEWDKVYATSGTAQAISKCLAASGLTDGTITRDGMDRLRNRLLSGKRGGANPLPAISKHRALVLPGGLAILDALLEAFGLNEVSPCKSGLRMGILSELSGTGEVADPRDDTVHELCRRYETDPEHSRHVTETALLLFDAVNENWRLEGAASRAYLEWAGKLFEVGLCIAHLNYHKHGAYLVRHADMPGFSKSDQRVIAALIGSHRKRLKDDDFRALPRTERRAAFRLSILLRIACILHRSRKGSTWDELQVEATGRKLVLRFSPGWIQSHSLSVADLQREGKRLSKLGFQLVIA